MELPQEDADIVADLLANGFKEYKPNPQLDNWDRGFQKRIRDENGTRYFIDVHLWDHRKYPAGNAGHVGYEYIVNYNDGTVFAPHPTRIFTWGVKWKSVDVLEWADQLWQRLNPAYYEVEDD